MDPTNRIFVKHFPRDRMTLAVRFVAGPPDDPNDKAVIIGGARCRKGDQYRKKDGWQRAVGRVNALALESRSQGSCKWVHVGWQPLLGERVPDWDVIRDYFLDREKEVAAQDQQDQAVTALLLAEAAGLYDSPVHVDVLAAIARGYETGDITDAHLDRIVGVR